MTSTEIVETIPVTVSDVDELTTTARAASLSHLGTKAEREGMALAKALNWWDAAWCLDIAAELRGMERPEDAEMWAKASAILDTFPKTTV